MATSKFKTASPYAGTNERQHHDSDWKYDRFLQGLVNQGLEKEDKVVSLALFGLGRAGTIHLYNIMGQGNIQLKYVLESDEARFLAVKKALNLGAVTYVHPDNVDTLLQDQELDAVIVATPTGSHEELITKSLEAGKAVFSEKPISEDHEAVKRCYQLATKMERPLFCAFNRRFDPAFGSVRQRVQDGELGQVQQIKLTSRDSPLPSVAYLKISGGIFHDCMVHDIDLMTHTLGELPIEVFTAANAFIPEIGEMKDYDNVVSTFKFASGTIGVVDISRFASYGYDQRLEVFGPGGMLQVDNDNPNSSVHYTSNGISKVPMYWSFPSRHAHGYVNELQHFIDVVKGRAEISVTEKMTLAVSKIAEAAEASARKGHPVALAWERDEIPENYIME